MLGSRLLRPARPDRETPTPISSPTLYMILNVGSQASHFLRSYFLCSYFCSYSKSSLLLVYVCRGGLSILSQSQFEQDDALPLLFERARGYPVGLEPRFSPELLGIGPCISPSALVEASSYCMCESSLLECRCECSLPTYAGACGSLPPWLGQPKKKEQRKENECSFLI